METTMRVRKRSREKRGPLWMDLIERLLLSGDPPAVIRELPEPDGELDEWAERTAVLLGPERELARGLLQVAAQSPGAPAGIESLPRAIASLGPLEVEKLVLALAVHRAVREWPRPPGIDRARLWRHSLAVATSAEHLSRTYSCARPLEAYAAGLLHDLGKVILDLSIGERATHAEVGAVLAARWRFPRTVTEAIRLHHARDLAEIEDPGSLETTSILIAADRVVHLFGLPGVVGDAPAPFPGLDVSSIPIGAIAYRLRNAFARAGGLFSIEEEVPSPGYHSPS